MLHDARCRFEIELLLPCSPRQCGARPHGCGLICILLKFEPWCRIDVGRGSVRLVTWAQHLLSVGFLFSALVASGRFARATAGWHRQRG